MVSYNSFNLYLQIGSRASQRSGKNVDEALFGGSKGKTNAGVGFISQDELRSIRAKTEKNTKNDAVVISKNDLNRIKDATVIKTKDELINEKKLLEE